MRSHYALAADALVSGWAPATLEDAEVCFDSQAGVVAIEDATLAELVKSNAALTATNATLTAAVDKLTKELAVKRAKGGGSGGSKAKPTKHCPHYKRDTWHNADDCFKLDKNTDKRPIYWKSVL